VVRPERTLTLALPKTGLHRVPGELYLADIGIPPQVFQRIGVSFESPFGRRYWVRLDQGKKSDAEGVKISQGV
jgi:NAD(P)H-hydrate epimerase